MVSIDYETGKMMYEAGSDDKNIRAFAEFGGECVRISAEDEWCGDTETGFGATVTGVLKKEEAVELISFLAGWLASDK